jgi:hypothetical protein
MITMRQRVLLVAGWVVAAAVTSLVASGAVAVAGGQVNDRPLTKVLAADVAALPVEDAESGDCGEPLASGGLECTIVLDSDGAQDERPGPGQDPVGGEEDPDDLTRLDPTRPDGLPPTIESGDISASEPAEAGPNLDAPVTSWVVSLPGGTVSFAVGDDRITVPATFPLLGYSVRVDLADPTTVRVTFTRGEEQNGAVARWRDGGLSVETYEGFR